MASGYGGAVTARHRRAISQVRITLPRGRAPVPCRMGGVDGRGLDVRQPRRDVSPAFRCRPRRHRRRLSAHLVTTSTPCGDVRGRLVVYLAETVYFDEDGDPDGPYGRDGRYVETLLPVPDEADAAEP